MKNFFSRITAVIMVVILLIGFTPMFGTKNTFKAKAVNGKIEIFDASDFINIKNNLSGDYILMNDIDLSSIQSWNPIGGNIMYDFGKQQLGYLEKSGETYFTGSLDGNGHSIRNLTIKKNINNASFTNIVGESALFTHVYIV